MSAERWCALAALYANLLGLAAFAAGSRYPAAAMFGLGLGINAYRIARGLD